MNCQRCMEIALESIGSTALETGTSKIRDHLENCPECRSEYQEILGLSRILEADRDRRPYDARLSGLVVDVNRRLDAKKGIARFNPRYAFSFLAAVAAVMLMVFMGNVNQPQMALVNASYEGYFSKLTVAELIETAQIDDNLWGSLYSEVDSLMIDEFEDYYFDEVSYQTIVTDLSQSEVKLIRARVNKELKDVS